MVDATPERREPSGAAATSVDEYYRAVAPWIDRSLADRGDTGWWQAQVPAAETGPVLELGCGTGRVTTALAGATGPVTAALAGGTARVAAALAENGSRIIGIDRSDAMLALARQRPSRSANIHLIRGDLRALPLRDACIRCALAPDDPFIHLLADRDRQRAIDEAARVLTPDGRLLLELLWWSSCDRARARSANGLDLTRAVESTGEVIEVNEHWSESADGFVRARYRYRVNGVTAAEASFEGRRWLLDELEARLDRAGLDVVRAWGGFDARLFDPETAETLLVEARRRRTSKNIT